MTEDFITKLQQIVEQVEPRFQFQARKDIDTLLKSGVGRREDLRQLVLDTNQDGGLREIACWALSCLQDGPSIPLMIDALRDRERGVRVAAAIALGCASASDGVAALISSSTNDQEVDVRKAAAHALGLIGDPGAIKPLIMILHNALEDSAVRGMAAESLADIGDTGVERSLVDALDDDSAEVRFWTAYALGRLGSQGAVSALHRLNGDHRSILNHGTVHDEAIGAIQRIQSRFPDHGPGEELR